MHGKPAQVSIRKEKQRINLEPVLALHHRETIEDDSIVLRSSSVALELQLLTGKPKNNRSPT
jgi:hypothetical protein